MHPCDNSKRGHAPPGAVGLANEIGTVQPGKRANLLLTRQDPTQSIEAYDGVVKIILGGRVLERDEVMAH